MNVLQVTPPNASDAGHFDPFARLPALLPDVAIHQIDAGHHDLAAAIRTHRADVVAASALTASDLLSTATIAHECRRPCVIYPAVTSRSGAIDSGAMRDALRSCFYVAGSTYEAERVTARGMPGERTFVIGPAVDPQRFAAARIEQARRRFGVRSAAVIGVIGDPEAPVLVAAMARVWRHVADAQLLIAPARGTAAAPADRIRSAFAAGDRDRVILGGECREADRPVLYAAMDVVLDASGSEAIDLGVIEAWAAAKPIVGWRHGALPSLVDEGVDGLLAEYPEPTAIAVAIVELLQNGARAQRLGQAGRSKVLVRHTWTRVADQFEQVFRIARESAA